MGVYPALFRPPFGNYNDMNLEVLKQRGYTGLILWDFDVNDADDDSPDSPETALARYRSLANTYPERKGAA